MYCTLQLGTVVCKSVSWDFISTLITLIELEDHVKMFINVEIV